jgi:tetratricopeptide (TPR) repeat protein
MNNQVRLACVYVTVCVLFVTSASAQRNSTTGSRPAVPRSPNRSTQPTLPPQIVYYTGKVVMDTGIAPPSTVAIMRVCNGMSRRETFTSADGAFSFTVGDRAADMVAEASQDNRDMSSNGQFTPSNPMTMGQTNFQSPIADCELRADLSGYASSTIHLDQTMTNSDVGIIMLHSRGKKAEGMVSVASLEVPSKARREYEKGSELLEKGDPAGAEKSLRKAIDMYPKFAEAWLRLGDLEQRGKNLEGAMKDYQEAINSDPNLALPYLRMAFLTAVARDWEQTRKLTDRLIVLDPVNFPLAYYYNAVAELNLKHIDKAETNALRAESMDKQNAEPRVELLLASIYTAKGAYSSAIDHYRAYLKLVPDSPLSERVKTDIARMEGMAKSQTPVAPSDNR